MVNYFHRATLNLRGTLAITRKGLTYLVFLFSLLDSLFFSFGATRRHVSRAGVCPR